MKRHKLPVKPYLKKYLQSHLVDGVLHCEKRLVRVTTNSYDVHSFFERNKDSPHWILVEVASSSPYVLFGLYNDLQAEFRMRIFSVMAFAVKNGVAAMEAARQFLKEYDISDDEYSVESVYRTWSRRKEKYLNPTAPVVKRKNSRMAPLKQNGHQLSLFQNA